MQISDRCVVSFHYTLKNSDGEAIETSQDADPSAYLHGANNIIRGLEQAMVGHEAGDTFSVDLEPATAYGNRQPDLQQRVPIKHLVFKGKLKAGMVVQLNTDKGARSVTVVKAGRHSADIDSNHPLAGQSLSFDIEIVEVRAASEEEVSHGHAHGVGGHHH
ncbi:peptidylprolyl isomerase [Halieaceae bacterium IMCC14734]|uniref:Peptidyl-prolyl cis-trans isomerase n=1 Tax=Candidatus Litorirhabdus singularis TaxID=2518993 RepID=A0ABT3TC23_9GAMM|nr:peptidylprolyl isomerase [Candidatus Litorirhabdus singularis]MCX2979822.1 peptidylprolyl isomerase [Candidatus Litorirhabdus singularis]